MSSVSAPALARKKGISCFVCDKRIPEMMEKKKEKEEFAVADEKKMLQAGKPDSVLYPVFAHRDTTGYHLSAP